MKSHIDSDQPLIGYKVLEIGQYIAGPATSMILGDLGADVIKVEPPGGEAARHLGPGGDAMVRAFNRGKRSIELDLRSKKARPIFKEIVCDADIIVSNLRPGTLSSLGLDFETLEAWNRQVVFVSIGGYPRGTEAELRPSYDIALQAESGMMHITGSGDGPPQRVGFPLIDVAASHVAAQSALALLLRRGRTGVGGHVEISLMDVALSLQASTWDDYLFRGVAPRRTGNGQAQMAPAADLIVVEDGYFVLSAYAQSHWQRLCRLIGREELIDDERFCTNAVRVANRPALLSELERAFEGRTVDQCVDWLVAEGIVAGRVNDYESALNDLNVAKAQSFIDVPMMDAGSYQTIGLPYRYSTGDTRVAARAPASGSAGRGIHEEYGFEFNV